jgi:hypothetical protein
MDIDGDGCFSNAEPTTKTNYTACANDIANGSVTLNIGQQNDPAVFVSVSDHAEITITKLPIATFDLYIPYLPLFIAR